MIQRWSNIPVSTSFTLERVELKNLPTLIGKNASLDRRILTSSSRLKIEVEIEGESSGYFHAGTYSNPPEEEDERILTEVNFIYCDEEGNELGQIKADNPNDYDFEEKLYEADLPDKDY